MKNIILCGFMGCGKSTVGKHLSDILRIPFIDIDSYIEQKTNMTVKEIFQKYGEDKFRDMEHEACILFSQNDNKIISVGGGTLIFERNVDVLKENSIIILIECSYETLYKRLMNDTTRPLLQRNNKIKELLDKRMPIYRDISDFVVKGDYSPTMVANSIADIIKN